MSRVAIRTLESNPGVEALMQTDVDVSARSGGAQRQSGAVDSDLVDAQAQAGKILALVEVDSGADRGGVSRHRLESRGAALPEPGDGLSCGGEPRASRFQIADH